jgi:hypothetical protein
MPDPGRHAYDVQRSRLRAQYNDDETQNTNDGKADDTANAELQRDNPPGHSPHPPAGESHRFIFRLLALDRPLGLSEGVTAEQLPHRGGGPRRGARHARRRRGPLKPARRLIVPTEGGRTCSPSAVAPSCTPSLRPQRRLRSPHVREACPG